MEIENEKTKGTLRKKKMWTNKTRTKHKFYIFVKLYPSTFGLPNNLDVTHEIPKTIEIQIIDHMLFPSIPRSICELPLASSALDRTVQGCEGQHQLWET